MWPNQSPIYPFEDEFDPSEWDVRSDHQGARVTQVTQFRGVGSCWNPREGNNGPDE